jgi:hypothetical protein
MDIIALLAIGDLSTRVQSYAYFSFYSNSKLLQYLLEKPDFFVHR